MLAEYGRLDVAVHNAGMGAGGPLVDTPLSEWRQVLAVNLDGVFLTLRSALRLIREGGRGGAIVVVSSASAVKAEPGIAAYGASKAAVLQLARVAARESAPDRIRVNAILPAGVQTPIWRAVPFFQQLLQESGGEQEAFDRMAALATPAQRPEPNVASGVFAAYWQVVSALTEVAVGALPSVPPVSRRKESDER